MPSAQNPPAAQRPAKPHDTDEARPCPPAFMAPGRAPGSPCPSGRAARRPRTPAGCRGGPRSHRRPRSGPPRRTTPSCPRRPPALVQGQHQAGHLDRRVPAAVPLDGHEPLLVTVAVAVATATAAQLPGEAHDTDTTPANPPLFRAARPGTSTTTCPAARVELPRTGGVVGSSGRHPKRRSDMLARCRIAR